MEMNKPLPVPNPDTQPFWDGCAAGELRYQQCRACGLVQFPPRGFCAKCRAADPEWKVSAGHGEIATFTVIERAVSPVFDADVPYAVALVDWKEGFRTMANVRNCELDKLAIGMPVRVLFERASDTISLPQCQPA